MKAVSGETKFFTETKGSIFPKGEMTKRNFYLQLFRTYCELPFEETMQSFVKVFNDVFVKEKPQVCHKYYLSEVRILELDTREDTCHEMLQGFRWNFAHGTSKEVNYLKSPYMRTFLTSCLKGIKQREGKDILNFTPRKKTEDATGGQSHRTKFEVPNNGREFFISNILIKIY